MLDVGVMPDRAAELIGWPPGSPFQLEVGFHDGACGLFGLLSTWIGGSFGRAPKQGKNGTYGVRGRRSSGMFPRTERSEIAAVDEDEFADHIEMQKYAERNNLDYTWSGTLLFAKRKRTLSADQFEVRAVRTKRGITMVGLFSAALTRAEREADAPYREAMAAKRLARVTRAAGRRSR